MIDQISDGQIEWARLDKEYDTCVIGYDKGSNREYPIIYGQAEYKALLKKQFPDEEKAIDEYFELCHAFNTIPLPLRKLKQVLPTWMWQWLDKRYNYQCPYYGCVSTWGILKILPLWLAKFVCQSGLIHLWTDSWRGKYAKTAKELIDELTDNKDLRIVFLYSTMAYGVIPRDAHFSVASLVPIVSI